MLHRILFACLVFFQSVCIAQNSSPLTVEKIMQDPKWIGTSPSSLSWSADGKQLFFLWNPDKETSDSLYYITTTDHKPIKASVQQKQLYVSSGNTRWNRERTAYAFARDGDIYVTDLKKGSSRKITQTSVRESNPQFSADASLVYFTSNSDLYSWNTATGETIQLTSFQQAAAAAGQQAGAQRTSGRAQENSAQTEEQWMRNDQLQYMQVLKYRKEKRESGEAYTRNTAPKELRSIPLGDRSVQDLSISPAGRFITYQLFRAAADARTTIIPAYVTETGFTATLTGRTKVGAQRGSSEFFVYDRIRDTVLTVRIDSIAGIRDLPEFLKDYHDQYEKLAKKPPVRQVSFSQISWSPNGSHAVITLRSFDNKDRWVMELDPENGKLKLLDRQTDQAWIDGPGINFGGTGWVDDHTFWFQSEATGYSHLYVTDLENGTKKALTSGNYEVQKVVLSRDRKYFFITTNEVHPGEQQFYRLPVSGGKAERITTMTGANDVTVSPDDRFLAILYSYSNKPWELYLQENKPGGKAERITSLSMSPEFMAYPWRDPELIQFKARDGAGVYARIYKPEHPAAGRPAVIFVHGAGYLQNAHKWWSSYFREYMFHNLLTDLGYTVMDMDYRGSAGYGREWRTGIYRHMGGKDLTDEVDGASFLVQNYGVDAKRIGIYGGSYGGFITLMALFTTPKVFAAGAALRPVTDWANYNHGYTSNILNEPFTDSIAYRNSSPVYYAEGLSSPLLICHGMMDINVHFQDAVKLTQRLIELGKNNWELAAYPLEDHGFIEPSSWTDEYKRILKLFERELKK
jgi:dipeptidyl aminopeptidase/acylaminoacyl peptidase